MNHECLILRRMHISDLITILELPYLWDTFKVSKKNNLKLGVRSIFKYALFQQFQQMGMGQYQHDSPPQLRKLFIGGLSHDTTDEQVCTI